MAVERKSEKKVRLRLVLDISYRPNGVGEPELRERLDDAVLHLFGEGLITGESDAEVDEYRHRIETVSSKET